MMPNCGYTPWNDLPQAADCPPLQTRECFHWDHLTGSCTNPGGPQEGNPCPHQGNPEPKKETAP